MTLEEIQTNFGTTEGYFYRSVRNKTELQMLQDLDTVLYTLDTTQGLYIRTLKEVTHEDYEAVQG
jgi:hypothetical protein